MVWITDDTHGHDFSSLPLIKNQVSNPLDISLYNKTIIVDIAFNSREWKPGKGYASNHCFCLMISLLVLSLHLCIVRI